MKKKINFLSILLVLVAIFVACEKTPVVQPLCHITMDSIAKKFLGKWKDTDEWGFEIETYTFLKDTVYWDRIWDETGRWDETFVMTYQLISKDSIIVHRLWMWEYPHPRTITTHKFKLLSDTVLIIEKFIKRTDIPEDSFVNVKLLKLE